jgi:hypothetical protein
MRHEMAAESTVENLSTADQACSDQPQSRSAMCLVSRSVSNLISQSLSARLNTLVQKQSGLEQTYHTLISLHAELSTTQ